MRCRTDAVARANAEVDTDEYGAFWRWGVSRISSGLPSGVHCESSLGEDTLHDRGSTLLSIRETLYL
jgi:hypothetical protein